MEGNEGDSWSSGCMWLANAIVRVRIRCKYKLTKEHIDAGVMSKLVEVTCQSASARVSATSFNDGVVPFVACGDNCIIMLAVMPAISQRFDPQSTGSGQHHP